MKGINTITNKIIQVNGTTTWMNIVPNNIYGQTFNNQEYWILLSQYLGADILKQLTQGRKCGQNMDKKGYHSLHCKYGGQLINRHNSLKYALGRFFQRAGYNVKYEQKYKLNNQNQIERVDGVPGDLLVEKWNDDEQEQYYMDITVGI